MKCKTSLRSTVGTFALSLMLPGAVALAEPPAVGEPPQQDLPPPNSTEAAEPSINHHQRAAMATDGKAPSPMNNRIAAKMHTVNAKEIKMGHLAQEQASSDAVKNYGKMLVDDHTKADQELEACASNSGIRLPEPNITAEDRKDEAHLRSLHGASFDSMFLKHMRDGHHQVIAELKAAKPKVSDSELKALIEKQLPTIESHEEKAKELLKRS